MAVNVFRWLLPRLLAAVTGLLLTVDPAAATEDFIYQVLDATQVVEFQARYLDTDQEGTFHIVPGTAEVTRVFLRYRTSSPAAGFFLPGQAYTRVWGRTQVTHHPRVSVYAHYVAGPRLRDVEAWRAYPDAKWSDISLAEEEVQDGVSALRGAAFVRGRVPWDFRQRSWRWLWAASKMDRGRNLTSLRLRELTKYDVSDAIGRKTEELLVKVMERTPVDVPVFLRQHRTLITEAARRFALHPELVAAVLVAENRDLNRDRSVTVKGRSLGRWNEKYTDWLGSLLGHDTSIGLGQVRASSVQQYRLLHPQAAGKSLREIGKMLQDPRFNIGASAHYIRIIANEGPGYRGALPDGEDNRKYFQVLPMADFRQHSWEWRMGHVILMGSEYTSKMWDGHWEAGWGVNVLKAYGDVLRAEAF